MNSLQEHIHITYLFRNSNEYFLTEEHGYVPNLNVYIECFKKALPEKFTSGKIFWIDDTAFSAIKDRFFKNIQIQVGVTFVADATGYPKGQYLSGRAFFSEKTNQLWNPIITLLYVTGSGADIVSRLTEAFAHELTHCYEDYQRALKGRNSLSKEYDDYEKVTKYGENAKPSEKFLKGILYFLNKSEQHAYLGELKIALQKGTVNQLKTSEGIISLLENTLFWNNYCVAERAIERLRMNNFKREITRDNMIKCFQEIYPDTKVKNFHELAKNLITRWNRWDRKFKNTIGKIAYDVYLEKVGENKTYESPEMRDNSKNYWTNINEIDEY